MTQPSGGSGSGKGLIIGPTASPSTSGSRPGSAALESAGQTQAQREAVVGGWGSVVPIVYGRVKLGGTIAVCRTFTGVTRAHVITLWSMGRCQGVNQLYLEDGLASKLTGYTASHYLGTAAQTYPSGLHAVYPAYTDNLAGIAYTYLTFGMGYNGKDPYKTAGADFSGRWLYDPREAGHDIEDVETWSWSENPALALADWIWRDDGEGRGFDSINWDSVAEAAEWNDDAINDRPRHTIGLSIKEIRPVREWREVLRAYAHCILYQDNGKTVMVPDRPRAVNFYFNAARRRHQAGQLTGFHQTRRGPAQRGGSGFHRPRQRLGERPGAGCDGRRTRMRARYSLPGITNYAEAYREALERLNRGTLVTRTCRLDSFSLGEQARPGDVIQVDDENLPITAGLFRVLNKRKTGVRNWGLECEAYDENVYSNAVAAAAALWFGRRTEPVRTAGGHRPDGHRGVEVRAGRPGVHADPRLPGTTWPSNIPTWTIRGGDPAVQSASPAQPRQRIHLRPGGGRHDLRRQRVYPSTVGRLSAVATGSVKAKGKRIPPSRVPSLSGLGLVGAVHLGWEPAYRHRPSQL